ncbi:MAG: hypothetical protein NVS9B1_20250 [Candidatus Dormibacteraceae bacterium]
MLALGAEELSGDLGVAGIPVLAELADGGQVGPDEGGLEGVKGGEEVRAVIEPGRREVEGAVGVAAGSERFGEDPYVLEFLPQRGLEVVEVVVVVNLAQIGRGRAGERLVIERGRQLLGGARGLQDRGVVVRAGRGGVGEERREAGRRGATDGGEREGSLD